MSGGGGASATLGAKGGLGFGKRDDRGGGRAKPRRGGGGSTANLNVPFANGLKITGFAKSPNHVKEYVSTLKALKRSLPGAQQLFAEHVEFSEATVVQVHRSILYNAPTTESGIRSLTNLNISNPDNAVYSFIVEVLLKRESLAAAAPPASAKPPENDQ